MASKLPLPKNYSLQLLRGDILGGVTATVIALPIALAFGIASGLGAISGLYGAIAVGFFAALFGGTNTQISKPTAPMTVAMAVVVTTYADTFGEAFTIVTMAGMIQVLLGATRVGRYVAYTPRVVVSGFMSAIGLIVMVMHVLPLMGLEPSKGGALGTIAAFPDAIENVNFQALAVGGVALAAAVLWPSQNWQVPSGPSSWHSRWNTIERLLADGCANSRSTANRTANDSARNSQYCVYLEFSTAGIDPWVAGIG